jgi:hypothetical protein
MAVESGERRDPSPVRSGQTRHQGERDPADRAANRRRIIITSLLVPPAVMTLKARTAHASPSCAGSLNPSHHCT